jgi:hypothetical protein
MHTLKMLRDAQLEKVVLKHEGYSSRQQTSFGRKSGKTMQARCAKARHSGIFIAHRASAAKANDKDPAQVLPDFAGQRPSVGLCAKR